jgi:hypothetical protein
MLLSKAEGDENMIAIEAFKKQEENILLLLKAADLYIQYVISAMRGVEPDYKLIKKIVTENGISTLNYSWRFYLSEVEYEKLKCDGKTRKICEEIVLSVYTAIEQYLISKFKEYLKHILSTNSDHIYSAVEKRISYRSLDQIKANYCDYLNIHLPSFEPEIGGFVESWFQPHSSWEGLTMLSKARNEIAHEGKCSTYGIFYLVDAYAPLDFATRWVKLFDANFNSAIYEDKRHYKLVKEHDKQFEKTKK